MILIIGANGFIGQALSTQLITLGYKIRMAVRSSSTAISSVPDTVEKVVYGDLETNTDWSHALVGIDIIIHCAARVHVMHETASDVLTKYRAVNVAGTLNLAQQAAAAGVSRFILLSSIKVNGESTRNNCKFTASDQANPQNAYSISKAEAEQGLLTIAQKTDMEVVIIRPPLVYGPGAKGNFLTMLRWLDRGLPLPFGDLYNNKRSLVSIDNLVDLIIICIQHPKAANQVFLVSDALDLSTTELLQAMSEALNKPARLLPIPVTLLKLCARMFGKQELAQRLLGNLQVDIGKTKELLGWAPTVTVNEGLRKTAAWYLQQRATNKPASPFTKLLARFY